MRASRVSVSLSNMSRAHIIAAVVLGSVVVVACSDTQRPASAIGLAGSSGSSSVPHGGAQQAAGTAALAGEATAGGEGGTSGFSNAGDSGVAAGGTASGGAAGTSPVGGAGPDPLPPTGDPPLCVPGRAFAAGTRLPLSGAGDDLLQAITPDDLTIAWKNGDQFFVADWDGENGVFAAPQEVAGGAQYSAVTLSPDGLQLIGIKQDFTVVEQTRGALEAFDDATPEAGDFAEFNAARASIPLANQVLADVLVGWNDASLFFSHFTAGYSGSRATVFESFRSGGSWTFATPDLGERLYAQDEKRRIPTGVSADLLTLFYVDEVNGDFRAAWRVNTQVPFDYSEVLVLGTGVQAAAPTASCQRIYYSAPGTNGLDLFVSDATP